MAITVWTLSAADADSWSGYLVDNGCIVFDNYNWPFGDGLKRAGDELLRAKREQIAASFVMGGAFLLSSMLQRS
jgi:hypothetical protein